MHAVCFPRDDRTGYAVGAKGTILKTNDAGQNWGTCGTERFGQALWGVWFVTVDVGYAVGNAGAVLRTVDGGSTWDFVCDNGPRLRGVHFPVDAVTGFAVGEAGVFLRTKDGGTTWERLCAQATDALHAVQFLESGRVGYAVGARGRILKTTDAGNTWETRPADSPEQRRDAPADFRGLCFWPDAKTGYVVGTNGTIFRTDDGAGTFSVCATVSRAELRCVRFPIGGSTAGKSRGGEPVGCVVGSRGTVLLLTPDGVREPRGTIQRSAKARPAQKLPAVEPHDNALGERLVGLREVIESGTSDYVNSTAVTATSEGRRTFAFDIKDILLLGAITGSGCLLTGRTGAGKTHLAKMAMVALFGDQGYFNKTITPGMSASDFLDIDFGAIQRGEKTLREAMKGLPLTRLPGIILNEANRAPELVQAVLIPFFDDEFEVEGVLVPLGVDLDAGRRYQYRVLTINEGAAYTGVVGLDRAVRDRMVIEVPMDRLSMTREDVSRMLTLRKSSQLTVAARDGRVEDVLAAYRMTQELPVGRAALDLLVYLNGLGNCVRSATGTKSGISFTTALCSGCHHLAARGGICGAVSKPSARALLNLQAVARGIAALRLARGGTAREVLPEDLAAAAPLVLYSKLELDPGWVAKTHQGDKWTATLAVLDEAERRLKVARTAVATAQSGEEKARLQTWVLEKDAWLATWAEAGLAKPSR